jgi:predicted metalloprotease with PDZ domain
VAEASFDAWVKYYRPDENSPNSTISYYGKGALVALALDLRLRALGPHSIDDVMRGLWQRSDGGPVSEADILDVVTALCDAATAQALSAWVHGTDDLPLPALLQAAGVQWQREMPGVAQRLGLRVSEAALSGVQVKQVLAGSAAQAAGFCAADELIGCNGWRVRRLDDVLLTLPPAQTRLRCTVARDQRLIELEADLPAATATPAPVLLSLAEPAPSPVLRRAWLGA